METSLRSHISLGAALGGLAALAVASIFATGGGAGAEQAPGAAELVPADRSPAACPQPGYVVPPPAFELSAQHEGSTTPPPNSAGPTLVGVGFRIDEIREIDPVHADFVFRGYVRTTWCDPRLAFDPVSEGSAERIFTGEQVTRELGVVWYPGGFPVNQVSAPRIRERVMRVGSDGTVEQDMNLSVHLSTDYDLRRFPFDQQTLEIQIESIVWDRNALQMITDEGKTGYRDDLKIPEWEIVSVEGRVVDVPVMRSRERFSRFILDVVVDRRSGFFVWKVFLPLLIIVALSWSVFWMPEENLASRSRISATGVLTIVAYQFIFARDLPRVGYLTALDKIMIVSFGLLAVTVLESMVVDYYQQRDPGRARAIDRHARWFFPLAYVGLLGTVISGV